MRFERRREKSPAGESQLRCRDRAFPLKKAFNNQNQNFFLKIIGLWKDQPLRA